MGRQITAIVFVVSVCWSPAAFSQMLRGELPPVVRLTGALLPPEEKGRVGLDALPVFIKGKGWVFRVIQVEKLTGRDPSGFRLLQDLFPRQLHLTGPPELIHLLQDPEIVGKPLVIEGRFYLREQMLFITAVTERQSGRNW